MNNSVLTYYSVEGYYNNINTKTNSFTDVATIRVFSTGTMCILVHPLIVVVSQTTMTVCVPIVYVWVFVGKPPGSHPSCVQEATKKIKETNCLFYVYEVENMSAACKSV